MTRTTKDSLPDPRANMYDHAFQDRENSCEEEQCNCDQALAYKALLEEIYLVIGQMEIVQGKVSLRRIIELRKKIFETLEGK